MIGVPDGDASDALVMARSGFHHSVNYWSVMAWGHAHAVTDRRKNSS